jgi:hypothetical protein
MGRSRRLLALAALAVVLTALAVPAPAAGRAALAAPTGPYAWPAPGSRWAFVADLSPPVGETNPWDHATAELAVKLAPDGICHAGDIQYEHGEQAYFSSPLGYEGSWGRLVGPRILCPAPGNHDASAPGPGSTGLNSYYGALFASLPCLHDALPCRPERGYYGIDLDVDRNGVADWFITVLDSNCGREGGGTGDLQTASCADLGEQAQWLRAYYNARHGGASSGRKCSIAVWHHERWGSGFFADDPSTQYLWNVLNHYHGDIVESGHTHSEARLGAMTPAGVLSPTGSGIRQITEGMGGRSHTDFRVLPARGGTRYRYNGPAFGVELLVLTVAQSPAGWQGGSWSHAFYHSDGTVVDPASSGCWP